MLSHRGPVVSVDIGFRDVVKSNVSLVIHDTAIKRFAKSSPHGVNFEIELVKEYPGFDMVRSLPKPNVQLTIS